jgi:hypothetical protein
VSADDRREGLARALRGDFGEWRGLPEGSTPDDFAALSGSEGSSRQGRLGGIEAAIQDYPGHPGLLRVWLDDEGTAFLVWVDQPELARESAGVLAELGAPDARLENAPSRIPGTVQWVWADRGVVAYVSEDGTIRGLALFAPTTQKYYEEWLGGHEGVPYRPYR